MLLYAVMLFVAYYIIVKSFILHYKHICAPQAAYYYIPLHCLMLYSSLIYNILHCLMLRDSILYHVTSILYYIVFILHDISLDWLILYQTILRCMTSSPIFHLVLRRLGDANKKTIQI